VPAGSLIFVIVVAIWAAYLLQHWVRRQENTAASRSVARFSRAMRVLDRPVVAEDDGATMHIHASGARVIRPVVDVKRATPAGDSRRSPLVARSTATVMDPHEVDPMPQPHTTPPAPRVSMAQRRLRAAVLLLALAWVPVSVVLVVLGRLLWVSIPFSLLTVLAVVVWLRTEVTADMARRSIRGAALGRHGRAPEPHVLSSDDTQVIRSEAVAQAAAAQTVGVPFAAAADEHVAQPPAHHSGQHSAQHSAQHAGAPVAEAGPAAYEQVFDGEAARSQPVPVQPPAEGTWAPVPVPRPTYAMKAKAEPRMTAGGVPADVFDTPEFAEEAEELDERARFARRAVSE
jgi:hypothetical protein